ncbi:MAG: glycosyltransferase family 39 protein, partial [Terriglobales bacterium]
SEPRSGVMQESTGNKMQNTSKTTFASRPPAAETVLASDASLLALVRRRWSFFAVATAAALALRLLFILRFPTISPDGYVYGDLAKNWLERGILGMSAAAGPAPTYIRLPGYPALMAAIWAVTGVDHYNAVRFVQMFADVVTCFVLADLARRLVSSLAPETAERAACASFALCAFCPFIANYTAVPLTETFAILLAAAALDCAVTALQRADVPEEPPGLAKPGLDRGTLGMWAWCGVFIGLGIMLRPDGGMLLIAIGGYLLYRLARHPNRGRTFWSGVMLGVCALAPLVPWTARNWITFHQFQPLAPVSANAPGEFVARGFERWMDTWLVDYASMEDIGFRIDGDALRFGDLPASAYDGPGEQARTEALFEQYNVNQVMTPALDAQFGELARERIGRAPLRYYVGLPLLRTVDLWFRPRIEMLPIGSHWWRFREEPRDTAWALVLGAINLFYVAAALFALRRWRQLSGVAVLLTFLVVRTVLIAAITHPEPRYVLECYPAIIALAAIALARTNSPRYSGA